MVDIESMFFPAKRKAHVVNMGLVLSVVVNDCAS